jgi:hypothetical protein
VGFALRVFGKRTSMLLPSNNAPRDPHGDMGTQEFVAVSGISKMRGTGTLFPSKISIEAGSVIAECKSMSQTHIARAKLICASACCGRSGSIKGLRKQLTVRRPDHFQMLGRIS